MPQNLPSYLDLSTATYSSLFQIVPPSCPTNSNQSEGVIGNANCSPNSFCQSRVGFTWKPGPTGGLARLHLPASFSPSWPGYNHKMHCTVLILSWWLELPGGINLCLSFRKCQLPRWPQGNILESGAAILPAWSLCQHRSSLVGHGIVWQQWESRYCRITVSYQ